MGNTCFMSSAIQCLSHMMPLPSTFYVFESPEYAEDVDVLRIKKARVVSRMRIVV